MDYLLNALHTSQIGLDSIAELNKQDRRYEEAKAKYSACLITLKEAICLINTGKINSGNSLTPCL